MFLITYRLQTGSGNHYSPSAREALRVVRELRAGGGGSIGVTRTSTGATVSPEELDELAAKEIGPADPKTARRFRTLLQTIVNAGKRKGC